MSNTDEQQDKAPDRRPAGQGRNEKRAAVKPALLLALACAAAILTAAYVLDVLPPGGAGPDEDDAGVADAAVLPVETALVREDLVEDVLPLTGEFRAYEQTRLSFKIPGYVDEVFAQEGDAVEAGDTLARLDDTDFRLALRRAEAELQQARARLGLGEGDTREPDPRSTSAVIRARAEMEEAERRAERIRELARRDSASQSELDSAETALQVAMHSYQEALETALERGAALAMRATEVEQARQNLEYTALQAPFSGVIWQKLAGPGAFLEEGDSIYYLVRTDILRLRVEIPERDVPRAAAGQELRFRFAEGAETHTAELTRLMPQLDEDTRVLIAEAEVDNPGAWRPGLFVRADLVVSQEESAVTVPSNAITSFVGIHRVFVVEDGAAVAREVELGRTIDGRTVVQAGVEPGEEVILEPGQIRSGDPVHTDAVAT
jgi:RND family efflux transporter MFP subunit